MKSVYESMNSTTHSVESGLGSNTGLEIKPDRLGLTEYFFRSVKLASFLSETSTSTKR